MYICLCVILCIYINKYTVRHILHWLTTNPGGGHDIFSHQLRRDIIRSPGFFFPHEITQKNPGWWWNPMFKKCINMFPRSFKLEWWMAQREIIITISKSPEFPVEIHHQRFLHFFSHGNPKVIIAAKALWWRTSIWPWGTRPWHPPPKKHGSAARSPRRPSQQCRKDT